MGVKISLELKTVTRLKLCSSGNHEMTQICTNPFMCVTTENSGSVLHACTKNKMVLQLRNASSISIKGGFEVSCIMNEIYAF